MSDARGAADIIIKAFKRGNKLLIIGNGGSASQASHMAGELVGKFKHIRKALPAISLSTDTSVLTSIGNDISFDVVFSRQVEALGVHGDVLLCLSTSGVSNNVLLAKKTAEEMGLCIIDLPRVGKDTPDIQERQLKLIHKICGMVERGFI
jgi:D-sedoheptulose 7-phosphate isomerase